MKLLKEFGIIIGICFIGEFINYITPVAVPGNVLGMVILLILLATKTIKLEMIETVANFLLKHLAFFFIPAGVGLLASVDVIRGQWFSIILITVVSTVLVIITTGLTIQFLQNKGRS